VLAAAGAGKSQHYHYFRGRDELVEAAVGLRCAQVLAGLTQALGSVASLAGLEQALAGFVAGRRGRAGLPHPGGPHGWRRRGPTGDRTVAHPGARYPGS
jgi:AcrR family transcriptional regulator